MSNQLQRYLGHVVFNTGFNMTACIIMAIFVSHGIMHFNNDYNVQINYTNETVSGLLGDEIHVPIYKKNIVMLLKCK